MSPVLYTQYLAELLNQDTALRFGYADDVCLYRATHTLDENVTLLAMDIQSINSWGSENKVTFAPEKQEMIHLTKQRENHAPDCIVGDLTITPIPQTDGSQAALRWLGV
jgi:hypothetical protein